MNYNANLIINIFAGDRFNYDVLVHINTSRTRGESVSLRLDRINWGNYALVVIDESHNFRNARRHRADIRRDPIRPSVKQSRFLKAGWCHSDPEMKRQISQLSCFPGG